MVNACLNIHGMNRVLVFSMDLMVYNTGGVPVPQMQTFWWVQIHSQCLLAGPDSNFQLQDANNKVIAFFHPTRPTRYQIGDVFGELHFLRTAGAGTVVSILRN